MAAYPHVRFVTSANKLGQLPPDVGAEVAVAGRSNAGKSSAINAITQRKGLARTSKSPGATRLLNFFELEPNRRLVDLPGYGFAKVSGDMRAHWGSLLEGYFAKREHAARHDRRHGRAASAHRARPGDARTRLGPRPAGPHPADQGRQARPRGRRAMPCRPYGASCPRMATSRCSCSRRWRVTGSTKRAARSRNCSMACRSVGAPKKKPRRDQRIQPG